MSGILDRTDRIITCGIALWAAPSAQASAGSNAKAKSPRKKRASKKGSSRSNEEVVEAFRPRCPKCKSTDMRYVQQNRKPYKTAEGAVKHICKVSGKPYDTVHFHWYICMNCYPQGRGKKTLVKWKAYKGDYVDGSELT